MGKYIISETIRADAFIPLNKALLREIGLHNAVFICDLVTKEAYFRKEGRLQDDGYFYNTEANRQWDTGLNPNQQRRCVKSLEEMGVLKQKRKGNPAKQYFLIDLVKIGEIIETHAEKRMEYNTQKNINKLSQKQEQVKSKSGTSPVKSRNSYINKNNKIKLNKKKKESEAHFFGFHTKQKIYLEKNFDVNHLIFFKKKFDTSFLKNFSADPFVNEERFFEVSCRFMGVMQIHNKVQYTESQILDGFHCIASLLVDNKIDIERISDLADWYTIPEHAKDDYTTKVTVPSHLTLKNFRGLEGSIVSFERNHKPYKKKSTKKSEDIRIMPT